MPRMKRFSHSHIQSNLQQATTQNVKSYWLLTGGSCLWAKNPEKVSSYRMSRHMQFLSYGTVYVQFHVVTKIFMYSK